MDKTKLILDEPSHELCSNCGHHRGAHIFSSESPCLRCVWFGAFCKEWKASGKYTTRLELSKV